MVKFAQFRFPVLEASHTWKNNLRKSIFLPGAYYTWRPHKGQLRGTYTQVTYCVTVKHVILYRVFSPSWKTNMGYRVNSIDYGKETSVIAAHGSPNSRTRFNDTQFVSFPNPNPVLSSYHWAHFSFFTISLKFILFFSLKEYCLICMS